MMILILSDKNDVHADKVQTHLEREQADFVRMNLDMDSLQSTCITYDETDWHVNGPAGQFKASEIRVVWARRTYVELMLEEMDIPDAGFKIWKGEWNKTLLGLYVALESKTWLNFYRDAYYAENKYRQALIARKVGFRTPPFICSNNRQSLLRFFDDGKEKVLKMMNQDFYKTADGAYKGIYVNKITRDDLEKFHAWGENPVILQNYIAKSFEVRYTVVGDRHLVCKIESQASPVANVDWRRYDLPRTPHRVLVPPDDVRDKVQSFMDHLKLNYGALDFIVDQKSEWHFLELNAMGQFLWIEDLTGLEISQTIANWLIINN